VVPTRGEAATEVTPFGVVVLAYRDLGLALRLTETLLDSGLPPHRILVLANAHSGCAPVDGVEVLSWRQNLGYAEAMNRGLARAKELGWTTAVLLTHDITTDLRSVRLLEEQLHSDERLGAVGPALLDEAGGAFSLGGACHRGGVFHLSELGTTAPTDVMWLDGAAVAVRLSALESVGGFDGRYFLYGEDVDLGLRLRANGWQVRVAPTVTMQQVVGAHRNGRAPAVGYLTSRNLFETFRKAGGSLPALGFAGRQVRAAATAQRPIGERVASVRGLAAGLQGRLGAPPPRLCRESDIVLP